MFARSEILVFEQKTQVWLHALEMSKNTSRGKGGRGLSHSTCVRWDFLAANWEA